MPSARDQLEALRAGHIDVRDDSDIAEATSGMISPSDINFANWSATSSSDNIDGSRVVVSCGTVTALTSVNDPISTPSICFQYKSTGEQTIIFTAPRPAMSDTYLANIGDYSQYSKVRIRFEYPNGKSYVRGWYALVSNSRPWKVGLQGGDAYEFLKLFKNTSHIIIGVQIEDGFEWQGSIHNN
ncbi:hypothetical protein [Burkholderia gladioli]|uniref:hypothetical protein n=1 Tax=Burkholderia gladioli TaxID=28095 RepID=UPI001641DC3B|nr:hypothetical protein [Burkholderia gladioli]